MAREQKDFISKLIPPRLEEESPLTRALGDIYEILNKLVDHVNETKGGSAIKSMEESALPGTIRVRKKGPDKYNVYVKGPDGWLESLNEYPDGKHYLWREPTATCSVVVNHGTAESPTTGSATYSGTVTRTGTRTISNDFTRIDREGAGSVIPESISFNGWRLIKKKDK